MSYIVNNTRGQIVAVVEDGTTVNNAISLVLVGKNFTPYGEIIAENMVYQLENFANNISPVKPMTGQIWWDTANTRMQVYNGTAWVNLNSVYVSETAPSQGIKIGDQWFRPSTNVMSVRTSLSNVDTWININTVTVSNAPTSFEVAGSLYFNSVGKQLFISDGTQWQLVGPEGVPGFGTTRWSSEILLDLDTAQRPVIIGRANGSPVSIVTSEPFTISSATPVAGFGDLLRGINLANNAVLNGTATSANRLSTARTINGVPFNGTVDVNVPTQFALNAGTNIEGNSFNGLSGVTWSVLAYADNQANGIVQRNSLGNFSTNTMFGNVVGNVQGVATNVTGVVEAANGGTGQSSFGEGEILVGRFGGLVKGRINATGNLVATFNEGNIDLTYTGGTGVGNITSIGITPGAGIGISGSPVTQGAGNITVQNTGVLSIIAGAGVTIDRSNGNVTISNSAEAFVRGMIMMFSGLVANVPTGWGICDGSNGTPDLRNRFVMGAGGTYATGTTGGSADAVVVSHTHSVTGSTNARGAHTHEVILTGVGGVPPVSPSGGALHGGSGKPGVRTNSAGEHTHSVTGTASATGVSGAGKNLPPFYALAFIMKL
jgi:hypothetical protein